MPIKRNSNQKNQTLIEFYDEAKNSSEKISGELGTLMTNWINKINEELKETEIWGLTSLYRLILQSADDVTSKKLVIIVAGMGEYHIEYLIPEDSQPWPNAYVKGTTKSLDEAMKMLKTAMVNSEGWKNSSELKKE